MKKLVVLCLLSIAFFPNCKKKETGTAYCVYKGSASGGELVSCEKTFDAAQTKMTQLRNSGNTAFYKEKTNCNDC